MRLHQLPNGNWIDLHAIISIRFAERSQGYGGTMHAPRIIVSTSDQMMQVIDFESNEDAMAARDSLAYLVNLQP